MTFHQPRLTTLRHWTPIPVGVVALGLAALSLSTGGYLFAAGFGALGIGLLMRAAWARRVAALLCLMLAIIIPVGVINPFHAGDLIAAQGQAPSLAQILLWLIPLELVLIGLVALLDPRRQSPPEKSDG